MITMERWINSTLIARTYYHNFVLIYSKHFNVKCTLIDEGKVSPPYLKQNDENLSEFWGDAVEITDEVQYTWMRQIHYYKGLYPYTYSAGLTIATNVRNRIKRRATAINDWLDVLEQVEPKHQSN